jgi:hypothetical protein
MVWLALNLRLWMESDVKGFELEADNLMGFNNWLDITASREG